MIVDNRFTRVSSPKCIVLQVAKIMPDPELSQVLPDVYASMAKLEASIADLQITQQSQSELLKGGAPHAAALSYGSLLKQFVGACEDHGNTMLNMQEVVEDYNTNRRGSSHTSPGSSKRATSEAVAMFDRVYHRMMPKGVKGVLYSPSDAPLAFTRTAENPSGGSPAKESYIIHGPRYTLQHNCIWVRDKSIDMPLNAKGYQHYVAGITISDGQRIAVDWGLAQFESIPEDLCMFIVNL